MLNFDEVKQTMEKINKIRLQAQDNLFSANHRNLMKHKYGYTEAESLTIEDLNNE